MSILLEARQAGYVSYNITAGEYYASREPVLIRTVLGSCIAVCLRDPQTGIGGMNHFMLAEDYGGSGSSARYGIHAMELLINACMSLGADRNRLEGKVFGGGHVMKDMATATIVPESNIRFALKFLATEGIPIRSKDVGGTEARKVLFYSDTGRTLLSRLECNRQYDDPVLSILKRRVTDIVTPLPAPPEDDSNITLF